MTTSVVVVSHLAHEWLEPCLMSVVGQADEVILVDNGSRSGSVAAAGHRAGVRVESVASNRGFAAGVNIGVRRAKGDVVALLNDDAVAGPGWLASSEEALQDKTVAAVGPKVLFSSPFVEIHLEQTPHYAPPDKRPLGRMIGKVEVAHRELPLASLRGPGLHGVEHGEWDGRTADFRWTAGSGAIYVPLAHSDAVCEVIVDDQPVPATRIVDLISCAGSYLSARGHGGDYGFGAVDDGRFDRSAERFGTTGAAMVVRAETFAEVGEFVESFFLYYEEFDWCWRARLAGMRLLYEPSAVIRHVGGVTTGRSAANSVRFLAARNRIHTLARNAPVRELATEIRSRVDRPESGMRLPLATRAAIGLLERRSLAKHWARSPTQVWEDWAGRDEQW